MLSLVLCARNDSHAGNSAWRLQTTLNYVTLQAETLGCELDVEVIVTDWDIEIFRVPGAYEMRIAIDKVAATRRFDGIIALGAVIRGGTPHFDYVAGECVKGITAASEKHSIPVGNGVLTVNTIEQAIERAGTKAGNKGEEAAMSALEMVSLLPQI